MKAHRAKSPDKLRVAERYSWFIIEAILHRIKHLEETIKSGQEALANEDLPAMLACSLTNMIEHCERLRRENQAALEDLRKAGFR